MKTPSTRTIDCDALSRRVMTRTINKATVTATRESWLAPSVPWAIIRLALTHQGYVVYVKFRRNVEVGFNFKMAPSNMPSGPTSWGRWGRLRERTVGSPSSRRAQPQPPWSVIACISSPSRNQASVKGAVGGRWVPPLCSGVVGEFEVDILQVSRHRGEAWFTQLNFLFSIT